MDPPPAAAWSQAWEILRMLDLLDDSAPTALGRSIARLGLAPRLGVLVLRGVDQNAHVLAAACAAILEERDGSEAGGDPDFRVRLEMIRTGRGGAESWRKAVGVEMERILRRASVSAGSAAGWTPRQEEGVGNLLGYGFPDRIARRETNGSYRLVTGRVARFPGTGGGQAGRRAAASRAAARWITAPDTDAGETSGIIRLAAPIDEGEVDRILALAAEESLEIRWEGLVPKGVLVRRAGRLSLSERPARPSPAEVAASFSAHLQRGGIAILPWNPQTRSLLARMRFYARKRPERGLGDMSEPGLAARHGEWLEPHLKLTGGQVLTAGTLRAALQAMLGAGRGAFEADVPESLTLPTGGRRAIDYEGTEPAVEARIQEVFGLAESPLVCGVPLTFRLLSPARRPLQITSDLASFWRTTYAEVRREMRGRYPKHYWPEDPLDAEPISGTRPRR
jgi:ATP-dependent helicase HrpB